MSWYAEIQGEVETSLAAYPQVMKVIGLWTKPKAEGRVELEQDRKAGKLRIRFHDYFRNLGQYVDHEIWKVAQAYPKETKGVFSMYSTDGNTYFALFRIEGGKVYRRTVAPKEEEVFPFPVRDSTGKELLTIMEAKPTVRKLLAAKGRRSARKRGGA